MELCSLANWILFIHDPKRKPLKKDSLFFPEKGHPLAKGYKGALWSIQGDHEFFSNPLKLPHWSSKKPCWECNASKDAVPANLWYKTLEKGKQAFKKVSNEEAMENSRSGHSLFSGMIPGLTTKMVRGDCLHILFCKGVLGHLLGGIIHNYLCWHDGVGVVQSVAPDKRLGALFQSLTKEYQRQGTPTRMNNLRMTMICDPQGPDKSFANLDLKASETKHCLDAFLPNLQKAMDPTSPHENAMLQATQLSPSLTKLQHF